MRRYVGGKEAAPIIESAGEPRMRTLKRFMVDPHPLLLALRPSLLPAREGGAYTVLKRRHGRLGLCLLNDRLASSHLRLGPGHAQERFIALRLNELGRSQGQDHDQEHEIADSHRRPFHGRCPFAPRDQAISEFTNEIP